MQVRKFEAPTMKEALEMVKNQLGPGAIILNAKDNSRGFGLMGRNSIEITAAISETELRKKQWAESRLKEEQLELLRRKPVRIQKEFIEKSVRRYTDARDEDERKRRPLTKMRYIDIDDEINDQMDYEEAKMMSNGRTVDDLLKEIGRPHEFIENKSAVYNRNAAKAPAALSADQRVKSAALSAKKAFEDSDVAPRTQAVAPKSVAPNVAISEVQILKNEILNLRSMIQNFQTQAVAPKVSATMHPGAEKGVSFELSGVYGKLSQAGVADEHILRLLDMAKKELKEMSGRQSLVEGYIAKQMMSEINIMNPADASPVQIFLGTTGSGKTSSLVKLASHYVIQQNKKVGILTADTEKVGAVEQLRTYAQILNVPFGVLKKTEDWKAVVESLKSLDYVLIDFPGNALKEIETIERMRKLLPPDQVPCDRHLVLSSTFKDKDAFEITERYRIAKPTSMIFSKLDEAITHGVIYNFQRKFNLPIFSFGTGPALPEDFEFATKERVLDLIFKITKLK